MEFKDVITISGMPGLYELVTSKSDGIIVKSLEDGKSQFIASRLHGVSTLDTISVYLKNGETSDLKQVLHEMKKKETEVPLPDGKSDTKKLQEYFKKIVPEYDEEKVHQSDMKKMVKFL
jgi:pentatricopeptide repeat protein